jgi:dihydroorotase
MLLIKGGRVIDPANGRDEAGSILIESGAVAGFFPAGSEPAGYNGRVVDAAGKWVVPGLVDMHVHLRDPGFEWKEDIRTGTAAAIAGGFTSVVCMANTNPVNDHPDVTRGMLERAHETASADVFPVSAVTKGLEGKEMVNFSEMADAGAVAFSDDGKPIENALMMRRALEYAKGFDYLILAHSEDRSLVENGAANECDTALRLGLPGIPAEAEEIAIARDILLAKLTGGRLHLQHISTKLGVGLLRMAKKMGLRVTGESAPHYFALTDAAIEGYDTNAKMNPPLRGEEDRLAIIEGLADGTLDAIATDHAPHELYVKKCEFIDAANGIIGLQTALPLTLGLVRDGRITPSRMVELLSRNPASILGLAGKGTLSEGADGDVLVVDPEAEWLFDEAAVLSKSKNSPFLGQKLKGRAALVLRAGRVVHSNMTGVSVDV